MGVAPSSNNNEQSRVSWKWEYLPQQFQAYPDEISAVVERYYMAGYNGSIPIGIPNFPNCSIDVGQNLQTFTQSGAKCRIIRDVNTIPKVNVVWSWENEANQMVPYSHEVSKHIEEIYQQRNLEFYNFMIDSKEYWIDLKNFLQISLNSLKKRRIERNVLPDAKYIWQWQNNSGKFINYSEQASNKIERDYFIKPDTPLEIIIQDKVYYVDLHKMCEIEPIEGNTRLIRRIPENYIRYKWLWKDVDNKWNAFSSYLSELFETHYLNPDSLPFVITVNYNQFEVNLNLMTQRNMATHRQYKIKRQPISNDFEVWGWTGKNGTFKWFSYAVSKLVEQHYTLNDPSLLDLTIRNKSYQVDIRTKTITNFVTKSKKKLERKVISNNYPPKMDMLAKGDCHGIFRFLRQVGSLPDDWYCSQKEEVQQFQVSDIELTILSEKFYNSIAGQQWEITNCKRSQNVSLINSFLLEKMTSKRLQQNFSEPRLLFYIGNKEDDIEKIYNSVDESLDGHYSPLSEYGKGYYFTESAELAKDYAWEKEDGSKNIICFWVLSGQVMHIKQGDTVESVYNNRYKTWGEVKRPPNGADCCKGIVNNEEVYVIYKAERCYPMYLIEFQENGRQM